MEIYWQIDRYFHWHVLPFIKTALLLCVCVRVGVPRRTLHFWSWIQFAVFLSRAHRHSLVRNEHAQIVYAAIFRSELIYISSRTAINKHFSFYKRDDNMTIANWCMFSVRLWQQNTLSHFHFDDDWTVANTTTNYERVNECDRQQQQCERQRQQTAVAIMCPVSICEMTFSWTQANTNSSKVHVQYSWMAVCVREYLPLSHHISIWHSLAHPIAISLLFYITLSIRFVVVFFLRFASALCCKNCAIRWLLFAKKEDKLTNQLNTMRNSVRRNISNTFVFPVTAFINETGRKMKFLI